MGTPSKVLWPVVLLFTALTCGAQPLITLQPKSVSVNQGFNASLLVAASGGILTYQWFFQSNAVPWGVTNLLMITNAQPKDAGDYQVVISSASGSLTSTIAHVTVILPAALDPKLSANIPIGTDAIDSTNRNQGEIHVARSMSDPQLLMAVFQDLLAPELALAAGYAVSTDGGLHWRRGRIPEMSKLTGGIEPYAADNVAAVDLMGNLFQISGSFDATDLETFPSASWLISQSSDGGHIFSTPIVLATNDSLTVPDKGWLAIDLSPKSAHSGRIAFSYTANGLSGLTQQTYVRISDDHGISWSPRVAVGPNRTTGSQTFFLPDGTLAVLYRSYQPGTGQIPNLGAGHIEIAVSVDGGRTFDPPSLVQDLTGKIYSVWPKEWDSVHFPSACSDTQAGAIYVAYQALGPNNRKSVMFSRSIDKGKTWSAPLPVNDTPNNRDVFSPAVAVSPDGQHVVIEFYDQRNQTTATAGYGFDLYLAESFDGGETWQPNLRLTEFTSDLRNAAKRDDRGLGAFLGDYQAIAPSLNFRTPAVGVWIDTRAGNNDPFAIRIQRTKGTSFEAWQKLRFSTNDLANSLVSGPDADPDHDGIPNLTEYALGLEPNRSDSFPFRIRRDNTHFDAPIVIEYERLAVLGDVKIFWETSTDLLHWQPMNSASESVTSGSVPWMETAHASFVGREQVTYFRFGTAKTSSSP